MPGDVIALMDHLGISVADLMGYSMGGIIATQLLVAHETRFRSVILAGIGDAILTDALRKRAASIASALGAPAGEQAADETARGFRIFAERTGNDLAALAAMQRAPRERLDAARLAGVSVPVMVIVGDGDTLIVSAEKLAAAIPGARHETVPGDHLTAVAAPELRAKTLAFLAEHSPPAA